MVVASLLHDIGKLVLRRARPGYPKESSRYAGTPEERVRAERLKFGADHALVGGVLARGWNLPDRLARVIEHHHADQADADAAVVRLADMIACYASDGPVEPKQVVRMAAVLGITSRALRALLYDVPLTGSGGNAMSIRVPFLAESSRSSDASPRARSTSRSRTKLGFPRARSGHTSTTPTRSWAPSTGPRPSCSLPGAAGCKNS